MILTTTLTILTVVAAVLTALAAMLQVVVLKRQTEILSGQYNQNLRDREERDRLLVQLQSRRPTDLFSDSVVYLENLSTRPLRIERVLVEGREVTEARFFFPNEARPGKVVLPGEGTAVLTFRLRTKNDELPDFLRGPQRLAVHLLYLGDDKHYLLEGVVESLGKGQTFIASQSFELDL